MKYFDFGTGVDTHEMYRDIIAGYVEQFEIAKDSFPPELTYAEKFIAYMLIVNIHATCCLVPDDETDDWRHG